MLPRNRLTARGPVADAEKQAGNADVFVQSVPMEPGPAAANLRVFPLLGRRRQESWEVGQWDGQLTAIGQLNPKVVGVEPHADGFSPGLQRIHSTPFVAKYDRHAVSPLQVMIRQEGGEIKSS